MKQFISYFIQGLILFIPLIITLAIITKLFDFFAGLFSFIGFSDNTILNTGLGLILTLSFIAILGLLASSFVFKKFFAFLEDRKTEQNFISVQNGFDLSLKNGVIKKLQLGNLLAKRDWQHCFDAAVGISKILEKDEFELYVLGTGETYSIEDFLRMAFEVVGVSNWRDFVEISEAYMRPSEVNLLLSDPSKARKELGWVSTYDIKRIVSEMVFTDIERNRNAVSVGSRPN
jgi:hypothetical protein